MWDERFEVLVRKYLFFLAADEELRPGLDLREFGLDSLGVVDLLGLPMDILDLGGGFGAPYAVPGHRPVYGKLRIELEKALDYSFPRWRSGLPRIACESGRYLVGDCGELISRVTNVKESRGRRFVILDAGINTLGGMAGLGRLMPLAVQPDELAVGPDELAVGPDELAVQPADRGEPAGTQAVTLAGPLCTPGRAAGTGGPSADGQGRVPADQ
jgi:diaminopimelate decarboxylase